MVVGEPESTIAVIATPLMFIGPDTTVFPVVLDQVTTHDTGRSSCCCSV